MTAGAARADGKPVGHLWAIWRDDDRLPSPSITGGMEMLE